MEMFIMTSIFLATVSVAMIFIPPIVFDRWIEP